MTCGRLSGLSLAGFNVFAVTNDDTNPNIDISEIGWNLIDGLDI